MLSKKSQPKLIVILGPTASGKTKLALKLAKKCNGEIVSADSRTMYHDMDIGTSKPTPREQKAVRHHLLDIADSKKIITLADWQKRAYVAIDGIIKRGKTPFLVGGTGLYISSILDDYKIPQKKGRPRYNHLILGLDVPRPELYERINKRVLSMLKKGLEKEVRALSKKYSWDLPSMHGIGYREWKSYFEKKVSKKELIDDIQQATRNFAKRQMTWFRGIEKRHAIHWIKEFRAAEDLTNTFLKK